MEKKNIAHVVQVVEGWFDASVRAPAPPPVVAFLREFVVGLKELPSGDTEIDADVLGNLISSALGEMPGD
jgi:hypothetical protein